MNTDDLIKVYNVLSKEECEDIIDWFWEEEDRHVDGAVYGRPNDVRKNHVLSGQQRSRKLLRRIRRRRAICCRFLCLFWHQDPPTNKKNAVSTPNAPTSQQPPQ